MWYWSARFCDAGSGDGGGGNGAPTVPMIKVRVGDSHVEVPRPEGLLAQPEIDERYVPKAAHNDQMARLRRELDGMKGLRNPEELLADPDFRGKAMTTWGLDPNATSEQYKAQLERAKTEITEREVKPREIKLAEATTAISQLRMKDLRGQIVQAAAAGKIDEKFLRPPTKGGKPLIVSMLEDAFGFDAEHGEWFAKGATAGQFAYSQGGELPYQTVSEFFQGWLNGDGKEFVRPERQNGAEARPGEGVSGQVGRELRLTAEQVRDHGYFKQMVAKAEKEGLQIVRI